MTQLTKEDYYRIRGEAYDLEDPEGLIRYENALAWMTLEKGVSVREIGCKFAVLRDMLESHGGQADYKAVDIDPATLEKIPGFNEEQFICHNVNDGVPFDDDSADYLVALEVLEHLENATAFLSEAVRILRPSGKLIVSVPNPYCWMEWLVNVRREADTEGHIGTYTHQNMDALLRFSGLVLRDVKGTFTRVPFSRRVLGRYALWRTSRIFLTRSFMFLIEKP